MMKSAWLGYCIQNFKYDNAWKWKTSMKFTGFPRWFEETHLDLECLLRMMVHRTLKKTRQLKSSIRMRGEKNVPYIHSLDNQHLGTVMSHSLDSEKNSAKLLICCKFSGRSVNLTSLSYSVKLFMHKCYLDAIKQQSK